MDIRGSSAIVTGAASGLGRATAERLLEAGAARVYGLDLQMGIDKAEALEGLAMIATDVTDGDSVKAAIDHVRENSADAPLRLVVNCAGIATPGRILSRKGVHDLNLFAKVIQVNLLGTFNVMALAAEVMAETEPVDNDGQRGLIVNTASVAAFEGQIGQAAYAASKGGVHALTLPAARDLADKGIRVNTIAPGIVETPMMAGITPEFRESLEKSVPFPARLARPDEYAQVVMDFVNHDYINGHTLRMDGAIRMAPR